MATMKDEINDLKQTRILDAASRLFQQHGYSRTSMDAIAEALEVTKPFIYHYFEGKADILARVCGRTTAFVAEVAETACAADGSARDRLAALVHALTLRVIEGRVYLAVYFREEKHLPEAAFRRLADNRRRFDRALTRLLQQGVDAGEFSLSRTAVATQAITGMTTWVYNWYRPAGPLSATEIADEMVALVIAMVERRARG
jgi:AcrR family transcriptional regulator